MGLLGASGSGKSMTLRCIAGLVKPDEGRIVLNGRVLFDSSQGINLPSHERKVGLVFQNYALFPNMTVEENIGFALNQLDRSCRHELVQRMIKMVKLEDLGRRYPSELSGGQQQRVALARALAVEPQALLLDEPFSALDEDLRIHMTRQLQDLLANYHGATIFVTHNMEEAYRICQQMVVVINGKVEMQGNKAVLFRNPPSLASAQLTGCRNFSAVTIDAAAVGTAADEAAVKTKPFELIASDWGIRLKAATLPLNKIKFIGLRAHCIRLATAQDLANVFNVWPSYTSETPFRMTVFLTLERQPTEPGDYHLQWEVSKEKWLQIQNIPLPWQVFLDPYQLMYLDR